MRAPRLWSAETPNLYRGRGPEPAPGDGRARGLALESPGFAAAFENGGLVSYRLKGEELLAGPLVPHLWRVPTDNDEGGGPASFAHRWREAGLDALVVVAEEPRVERPTDNQVRVVIESRLTGKAAGLRLRAVYEVDGLGSIRVGAVFEADGKLPPLPRVGFQLQQPGSFDTVRWYGRGPSNHTDVRWVGLTDAGGHGLRFSGEPRLDFTAHDFTDAALLAAKRSQVIEKDGA